MAEPYKHQDFPKVKYHRSKPQVTVADAEAESKLGKEWKDKPFDSNTSHVNPLTVSDMKREAKQAAAKVEEGAE